MIRKSSITFISYFVSVWKVFALFFKNEGRKFSNDKVHLCNSVVFMH